MRKINRLLILGFNFELNDKSESFEFEGKIIPEYCKIIPFQNESGELTVKVNIAVEEVKGEKNKCKISLFECASVYKNILCLEDVLFYDLYTNNISGIIEEWHIFVNNEDE
jgi:hypothetical protein